MDCKPPISLTLMRRLLLFNVLADNFDRVLLQLPGRPRRTLGEDAAKVVQNDFCEHSTAVFCHEDQVSVHQKNAMSALSNVVALVLGKTIIYSCNG